MPWLSGANKTPTRYRTRNLFFTDKSKSPPPPTLGILSFESAKTMSRLVSLYKSLTDDEIFRLRHQIIKSEGVMYLNSKDEKFLLNLACAERLEDLNHAANTVSRIGKKCFDFGLKRFDRVYADIKLGNIGIGKLEFDSRDITKLVEKMEKFIWATSQLYSAIDTLEEMEAAEQKINRIWRKDLIPKQWPEPNFEFFREKVAGQRKRVKYLIETSLWGQTFDKSVGLMARLVCIIYARLCTLFGPSVSCQPTPNRQLNFRTVQSEITNFLLWNRIGACIFDHPEKSQKPISKSGPIPKAIKKELVRFSTGVPNRIPDDVGFCRGSEEVGCVMGKNNRVYRLAPAGTVGGSGLSLRYANVILLLERCLHVPAEIGTEARETLYDMLPENIRSMVRAKLRRDLSKRAEEEEWRGDDWKSLADGWRTALRDILRWFGPVAHDTVRWQTERTLERQQFDARPTALLLQTLHYSDMEKTEAAIVQVLVGLSCIYECEMEMEEKRRD